jgi:hypothetical protein
MNKDGLGDRPLDQGGDHFSTRTQEREGLGVAEAVIQDIGAS